jgi:hypothetical protein
MQLKPEVVKFFARKVKMSGFALGKSDHFPMGAFLGKGRRMLLKEQWIEVHVLKAQGCHCENCTTVGSISQYGNVFTSLTWNTSCHFSFSASELSRLLCAGLRLPQPMTRCINQLSPLTASSTFGSEGGSYFFKPNHIMVRVNVPIEVSVSVDSGLIPHSFVMHAPEDFIKRIEIWVIFAQQPRLTKGEKSRTNGCKAITKNGPTTHWETCPTVFREQLLAGKNSTSACLLGVGKLTESRPRDIESPGILCKVSFYSIVCCYLYN